LGSPSCLHASCPVMSLNFFAPLLVRSSDTCQAPTEAVPVGSCAVAPETSLPLITAGPRWTFGQDDPGWSLPVCESRVRTQRTMSFAGSSSGKVEGSEASGGVAWMYWGGPGVACARSGRRRGFSGRVQTCFVLVAGAGVGDGVGVALVVAVADAEGVGEIAADAADAVEDGATAGALGVGVVLELGVGDGDDETGTFSV